MCLLKSIDPPDPLSKENYTLVHFSSFQEQDSNSARFKFSDSEDWELSVPLEFRSPAKYIQTVAVRHLMFGLRCKIKFVVYNIRVVLIFDSDGVQILYFFRIAKIKEKQKKDQVHG